MPNLKRLVNNGNYFYFKDAPIHISGVYLDKHSIILSSAGQTEQLTATVSPEGAIEDPSVTWSSSDTSIATVSNTGLVTCVNPGNCTITVTTNYGGFTDTCAIADFTPIDTTFSYTGNIQSILLKPHSYCLEIWGASGGKGGNGCTGSADGGEGGKGGYSYGVIDIQSDTTLYIAIGGVGQDAQYSTGGSGGYNGGGAGAVRTYSRTGGGGGATHIATSSGLLCTLSSNQSSVIMVAGGGGSTAWNCNGTGGYGGGTTGGTGWAQNTTGGTGGTQSGGGTGGASGIFGKGGDSANGGCNPGGAGGGGWYGGGSGCATNSGCVSFGGGGSGYVKSTLTNCGTCGGNCSFPATSSGTETGHTGCGYARIRSI